MGANNCISPPNSLRPEVDSGASYSGRSRVLFTNLRSVLNKFDEFVN